MNKIILELDVDDLTEGIDLISIVDKPAIESAFVKLSEESLPVRMAANDDKQILTGPALIPDKEIRRLDEDGQEYFIKFTAEAIERIKRKFIQTGRLNVSNLDHSNDDVIHADLVDVWTIENPEMDKAIALGLKDLPKGTLMVSYHIPDKDMWSIIKEGDYTGFSIEGAFKKKEVALSEADREVAFINALYKEMFGDVE